MIRFFTNTVAIARGLGELGDRARDMTPVLKLLGERMVGHSIPENFRQGGRPRRWPKSRSTATMRDTGRLLNSVVYRVEGGTLKVGTNRKYAPQRHFGGAIVPVNKKAIAIPINVTRSRNRPKHFSGLQWRPTKDTRFAGVLGEEQGRKTRRFVVRFLLARRVEQPARPFLLWQDDDVAYAHRATVRHVLGVR